MGCFSGAIWRFPRSDSTVTAKQALAVAERWCSGLIRLLAILLRAAKTAETAESEVVPS
jgi:hypothetical protein